MQNFWEQLKLVKIVELEDLDNLLNLSDSSAMEELQGIQTTSSSDEWKKQGHNMMKRKYFE